MCDQDIIIAGPATANISSRALEDAVTEAGITPDYCGWHGSDILLRVNAADCAAANEIVRGFLDELKQAHD